MLFLSLFLLVLLSLFNNADAQTKSPTITFKLNKCSDWKANNTFVAEPNQKLKVVITAKNANPPMDESSVSVLIENVEQKVDVTVDSQNIWTATTEVEVKDANFLLVVIVRHSAIYGEARYYGVNVLTSFPTNILQNYVVPLGKTLKLTPGISPGSKKTCQWESLNEQDKTWENVADTRCDKGPIVDFPQLAQKVYRFSFNESDCPSPTLTSPQFTVIAQVEPQPKIVSPLKVKLDGKTKVDLKCEVGGFPVPTVLWVKVTDKSIDIVKRGSNKLTLQSPETDVGIYKCEAVQPIYEQQQLFIASEVVRVTAA